MTTRLLLLTIFLLTGCSYEKGQTPLDNCSTFEKWTLKPLNYQGVKFQISFPDWQTEQDFVNGDTISITALDSIRYSETGKLRILSLIQYDTYIDIDRNFQAIKDGLISYSETGDIKVKNYVGQYMIREETFEMDTVTTFLTFFQTDKLAINLIARVSKDNEKPDLFCDFRQVFDTIDLDNVMVDKIAQAPTPGLFNGGRHSRP